MLKKLSILIVAGILVGCANIDNLGGKRDSGPIREIGGEPQIPGETKIVEEVPVDEGKVISKEANNENKSKDNSTQQISRKSNPMFLKSLISYQSNT